MTVGPVNESMIWMLGVDAMVRAAASLRLVEFNGRDAGVGETDALATAAVMGAAGCGDVGKSLGAMVASTPGVSTFLWATRAWSSGTKI